MFLDELAKLMEIEYVTDNNLDGSLNDVLAEGIKKWVNS